MSGKLPRAAEIYREEGLSTLANKAYRYYAPSPLYFRYGVKRTLSNSKLLNGHIKRNILRKLNELYHSTKYPMKEGTNIFNEDWDNLIILDACRLDKFEEMVELEDGCLESRTSIASRSPTFMSRNLEGRAYHDIVYICANPHVASYQEDVFHDVLNIWEEEWDEETGAILPKTVTEAAINAAQEYPNKRICVHYMQPHSPYIGKSRKELLSSPEWTRAKRLTGKENPNIFPALWYGALNLEREFLFCLYDENLQLVMEDVEILLEEFSGKTAISADHGELLGETVGPIPMKGYGHPPLYCSELREVPWYTVTRGERREVWAEDPEEITQVDMQESEQQLEALGYID